MPCAGEFMPLSSQAGSADKSLIQNLLVLEQFEDVLLLSELRSEVIWIDWWRGPRTSENATAASYSRLILDHKLDAPIINAAVPHATSCADAWSSMQNPESVFSLPSRRGWSRRARATWKHKGRFSFPR